MAYIETTSGNRIAREALITGPDRILIAGHTTVNPYAELHGLAPLGNETPETSITLGKYCFVDHHARLSPPTQTPLESLRVGNYVLVGAYATIQASSVGNRVWLGERVRLGPMSIVYDCCVVEDGAVVPPRCVVPPFSRVQGEGALFRIEDLNGCYKDIIEGKAREANVLGRL